MESQSNSLNSIDFLDKLETVLSKDQKTRQASPFESITYADARTKYLHYDQAVHVAIYAKSDGHLWGTKQNAVILMQMRFDGQLGFPGGFLDSKEEEPISGLNRELQEEIGLDIKAHAIEQSDLLYCTVSHQHSFVAHFYAREVTLEEFHQIECQTPNARDWGGETLGFFRVPLYCMTAGSNKYKGLPLLLANQFAGTARVQLVKTITERNLMPTKDLNEALMLYSEFINLKKQ